MRYECVIVDGDMWLPGCSCVSWVDCVDGRTVGRMVHGGMWLPGCPVAVVFAGSIVSLKPDNNIVLCMLRRKFWLIAMWALKRV
jgi:hypothetical protein